MSETLPFFKYHPNAIANGAIKEIPILCPVCSKDRPYVYVGPFYSRSDVNGICPWCIADGTAAKKFDGSFRDGASCEPVNDRAYLVELTARTPWCSGWQQEVWLSHCGDFCSFEKHVGWDDIKEIAEELSPDIERIKADMRMSGDEFKKSLKNGGSHQGYLFKCLHCGIHRLTSDLD